MVDWIEASVAAGSGVLASGFVAALTEWARSRRATKTATTTAGARVATAQLEHDTLVAPTLLKRIEDLERGRKEDQDRLAKCEQREGETMAAMREARDAVRECNRDRTRAARWIAALEAKLIERGAVEPGDLEGVRLAAMEEVRELPAEQQRAFMRYRARTARGEDDGQ